MVRWFLQKSLMQTLVVLNSKVLLKMLLWKCIWCNYWTIHIFFYKTWPFVFSQGKFNGCVSAWWWGRSVVSEGRGPVLKESECGFPWSFPLDVFIWVLTEEYLWQDPVRHSTTTPPVPDTTCSDANYPWYLFSKSPTPTSFLIDSEPSLQSLP